MLHLVLVRHGQCTLNREHRVTGWSLDTPLTELGLEQAGEAARKVADLIGAKAVRVVCSDALRAVQTACPIAAALGVEAEETDLAREQYLGEMEGMASSELRSMPVPEGKDITEVSWSGGETVQQLHARMSRLLNWLEATTPTGGTVVLVGHGEALRVLVAVRAGRGHREIDWDFVMANGEVRELS